MRRLIISAAALAALATPASLFVIGSTAPAGATTTPKSIACKSVVGSDKATGTVTISKCTLPAADATKYKSASAKTASLITGKGKITWSTSGKTTEISVTPKAAGTACKAGSSEEEVTGKVVAGGNAAITPVNQPIKLDVCLGSGNTVTLAPGTTAEL